MASRRGEDSLLEAGASGSEDDLIAPGAENRRNIIAGSRIKKTTTMARGAATKTAAKRKAPAKSQSRQALKDRTNIQEDSDTEVADNIEDDDFDSAKPKSKRAKTTTTKSARAGSAAPRSRTAQHAPAAEALQVIPETQADSGDVSLSIEMNQDLPAAPTPPRAQPSYPRARSASVQPLPPLLPRASARSASAQPTYLPPHRERSGSVSDSTRERRGGDPQLKRELNDLKTSYDNLKLKYDNLHEVAKSGQDDLFQKLKRASDDRAKSANETIASLKREIAELRKSQASSSETDKLQKQVANLNNSNGALSKEATSLKESLQTAQNEVKSLEAKLVAARQQLSHMATEKEKPAIAAATRADANRSAGANATDAQKEAKMKENLYSDLTGLIIRGVKTKEGEDEYDCIQTGRNGTLHFHLSIANDATIANPKTPSGLSYEEAEFAYEPLLDEGRDRDLVALLPDYLTEEICFPRDHAVKFYIRILESMTKRIEVEE